MNKEDYDKYYQKGGTYEIPTEIFNNLLDEKWKYEYFELKKFKLAWEELKNEIKTETKNLRDEYEEHHYENDDLADEYLSGQLLVANTFNTKWQELEQKHNISKEE